MTKKTRDPISPLYVPKETSRDLPSLELNALTSNVQDALKFLTAPSPELIVLIAQHPVNSALISPAALISKSLVLLDLIFLMVLNALIFLLLPKELSLREHSLLLAVLDQKPLLVLSLNLNVLLVLSAQQ